MTRAFTKVAFSEAVKAVQSRCGTGDHCARIETREPMDDRLSDGLKAYIAGLDSFMIATANRAGWPHAQHRGGAPGFLKVINDRSWASSIMPATSNISRSAI